MIRTRRMISPCTALAASRFEIGNRGRSRHSPGPLNRPEVKSYSHSEKQVDSRFRMAATPLRFWLGGVAWLLVAIGGSYSLQAQQLPQPEAHSPTAPSLASELLQSLNELKRLRQADPALPEVQPAASDPTAQNSTSAEDKLKSLQQKIELLRSLLEKSGTTRSTAPGSADSSHPGVSGAPNSHDSNWNNTLRHDGHDSISEGDSSDPANATNGNDLTFPMPNFEETAESNHSGESPTPSAPKYVGQTVIPNPVDPLELANSLFQTGNYDLALKTYQTSQKQLEKLHDIVWTEYFIASCQRIGGDLAAAETSYRNLVESKRPSRAVEVARWWLDRLESRKQATRTIQTLDQELQAIKKELDHAK